MYQLSVQVQDDKKDFAGALNELKQKLSQRPGGRLLFHLYSTVFSVPVMTNLVTAVNEAFPGCQLVCHTVSGAVMEHEYQNGVFITVEVFEHPDSRAEVYAYDLTDSSDKEVAEEVVQFVQAHSWVKAVEVYRTVHDMNTTDVCSTLSELPEDIVVFGGIVSAEGVTSNLSYLAGQNSGLMDKGVVAVYYGGSDLHIKPFRMSGWKPIDKSFTVTKAEKNIIREIDGAPAVDIFKRYLDIEPDEYFATNVLEFPFLSEDQGHFVVRNVFTFDPEGGLVVAYDVNEGTKLKICYADAASVVQNIHDISKDVMSFTPDVVSIISCITRSIIWQMKDYMPELQGFKAVAPCHGYLSYGELLRENGMLNHHNTILIAAAFREGGIKDVTYPETPMNTGSTIPLTVRLSTFISRVTDELIDMYSEVEQVATTDALTRIGNRYLFDDVVNTVSADADHAKTKYLLMLDLNGLKFVNDTFGHNEGDVLIKNAADTITGAFSQYGQCFRIGGDEFAVVADFESDAALQTALKDFYDRLHTFNSNSSHAMTLAVGYAPLVNEQGKRLSTSDWKMAADINMYLDKTKFHAIKPSAMDRNMSSFITCIMSLIDNKSPVTTYHSIRVQRMSILIARLMQLDDAAIDKIGLSAYLHDIGRIGISDTVLTKRGPLTDGEVILLRQKPAIGRRVLMTAEETKHIADIVYTCCEQWDGKGYPEGLSGKDIPLESRIIAVTNFIDTALYGGYDQEPVSAEACIRQLQENSGTMFDPAVIEVVLANFGDIIKGDLVV